MQTESSSSSPIQSQTYDEIYIDSWRAVLAQCDLKLEPPDHTRALKVKTASDFRNCLRQLLIEYPNDKSQHVLKLLFPCVDHYETFANTFVSMMTNTIDVSMLWGLLFLVIKISLETEETIDRISRMLTEIGHRLMLLNDISQTIFDFSRVKPEAVEINREIFILWLNIIMIFRTQSLGKLDISAWETLTGYYNKAMRNIYDASKRIEDIVLLTNRQSHMIDLAMFRNVLSLKNDNTESATLPCNTIPVARNMRFFGRRDILQEIENFLCPSDDRSGMLSIAICGLGGVGKSQIALEYACSKQTQLDAVLWIEAETEITLQQGLSYAAVERLKLPGAEPQAHQQNAILVMDWLSHTGAKWLLVYDNVESSRVFDLYWPAANHGSVLITTRRRSLTAQPINKAIGLEEFTPLSGAQFLVHLLQGRVVREEDPEFQAAIKVSIRLSGLALAISQMAALINARNMSPEKFIIHYDKYQSKMLQERKPGWKYPGYNHALDTVWELSFNALKSESRILLSIMSYLAPDSIPLQLFNGSAESLKRPSIAFCADEYNRDGVVEQLTDLALARMNAMSETLSVHRLVQHEFLIHISRTESQEGFDSAVRLLLDVFPPRGKSRIIDKDWYMGGKYIAQVLALLRNFRSSQSEAEPLKSSEELINLILDAIWFLEHHDTANNIETVINTGFMAWKSWTILDKDPLLYATLLQYGAIQDMWIGEYQRAYSHAQEALDITLAHLEPNDEQVLNCYNDLGLAYGCKNDYTRGDDYFSRAEGIFQTDPAKYPAKGILLNANIARNDYCSGGYESAQRRLNLAMAEAIEMESVFWMAALHIAYGSLFCRNGDLPQADTHLESAATAIERFGKGRDIKLSNYFAYRLGRLRLAQGRFDESITQLEKAVALDNVLDSPRGYRARNLYALSRAMLAKGQLNEASKTEKQALELLGKKIVVKRDIDDWDVFDSLVRIVER